MTFLNVDEVNSALKGLAGAYPAVTQLIRLPHTTAERRTSLALRIGKGGSCPHAGAMIISGVHAREWGGPDICVYFAADLLEAYTLGTGLTYGGTSYTAAQVRSIVERVDVLVFPLVNPDGRHFSQTASPWWRKNRNPASSGGQASRIGVDVNRNFDFLWNFPVAFSPAAVSSGTLASNDPGSDIFHGTAPFSEAETRNVKWLLEQFPQVTRFVDVHSYGGDVLHPWGDDENQAQAIGENFTNPTWNHQRGVAGDAYGEYMTLCDGVWLRVTGNAMANAIAGVRGETYAVDQSFFLPSWGSPYPTSGASEDWVFSRHFSNPKHRKVRAYVIEFNRVKTFFPTWAQMQPIIQEIDAALVRLCLDAVPRFRFPGWFCAVGEWLDEAIWKRLFPHELWGPYGPWGRLRQVIDNIAWRIVGPRLPGKRPRPH